MALHPTVRGQGFADALMHTALQICPDRDVVLDAQTPLAGWYDTLGFEVTGAEFLDDGIPHLPMRRAELHRVAGEAPAKVTTPSASTDRVA